MHRNIYIFSCIVMHISRHMHLHVHILTQGSPRGQGSLEGPAQSEGPGQSYQNSRSEHFSLQNGARTRVLSTSAWINLPELEFWALFLVSSCLNSSSEHFNLEIAARTWFLSTFSRKKLPKLEFWALRTAKVPCSMHIFQRWFLPKICNRALK